MNEKQLHNDIKAVLKILRLPAMLSSYQDYSDKARSESLSYEEYLYNLISEEDASRENRKIERLLRESRLPLEKTMASFERKRLPKKLESQLSSLMLGGFVNRHENILAFGNPGSGKTHLLCAIAHEMVHLGYSVLFKKCSLMVQELLVAKQDLKLPKYIKQLSRYDILIIDDIGYIQQSREEMEVLFTLLSERYERGSIMLTSNLPFSKWEQIFKDPMTAAAAIDRLVHHCIILELNLPSYRLEQSKKNKLEVSEEVKN
jgi:DNA replication protein DnaC